MKKRLPKILSAFLAMLLLVSLFGMSAFAANAFKGLTEADAIEIGRGIVQDMNDIVESGEVAQYASNEVVATAFEEWNEAMEVLVSYQGLAGGDTAVIEKDEVTITIHINGENERTGTVIVTLDEDGDFGSINVSADDTFGEAVTKAALNTVLGMGMAFFMLGLIAIIIKFVFPPINKMSQKKTAPAPAKAAAPAAPAAPVVEETYDDGELIAVIAAAIAASEGRTSTDGFVVRSIRRQKRA